MKALILSLVIAFSSSFALACSQADATFNSKAGAYTKTSKQLQTRPAPALSVASIKTDGQPK